MEKKLITLAAIIFIGILILHYNEDMSIQVEFYCHTTGEVDGIAGAFCTATGWEENRWTSMGGVIFTVPINQTGPIMIGVDEYDVHGHPFVKWEDGVTDNPRLVSEEYAIGDYYYRAIYGAIAPPPTLAKLATPTPLKPISPPSIPTSQVQFEWTSVTNASGYEVMLGGEITGIYSSPRTTMVLNNVPNGDYTWVVRATGTGRLPSNWSSPTHFTVNALENFPMENLPIPMESVITIDLPKSLPGPTWDYTPITYLCVMGVGISVVAIGFRWRKGKL